MYTIEDIRNKKVAIHNDSTLEELKEVLRVAFPHSTCVPSGRYKYYFALDEGLIEWKGSNKEPVYPIQSVKDFIKQIRGEESTISVKVFIDNSTIYDLKDDIKEQEYELVDFKIEDLKKDDILEMDDAIIRVVHNYGEVVIVIDDEGKFSETYSSYELNVNNFKLQIPKPKLEKIQGFEVREYPELPLVEVSDEEDFSDFNVRIIRLKEVLKNNSTPFFDGNLAWKYCRQVTKDKRNFIEIEE